MAGPSKVLAMDAGVPGVLIRMAGMPPAQMAELYTPRSMASPWAGGAQKVRGVRIATAMVAVSPGRAPIKTPAPTPMSK